ncbi:MAG: DUF4397 domain-containing protein [Candidatus Neomarinimicrobiota bacterium]
MTSSRLGIVLIVLLLVGMSCIDMDNPAMTTQDYKSEVRFVNLSRLGSATVKLADISFGSLSFGEDSEYKEIDAGSRTLTVEFPESDGSQDTEKQMVFATERKGSVFILGDTSGVSYFNAQERYIFEAPENLNPDWTNPDSAIVRIFSALSDFDEVSVNVVGNNSSFLAEGLSYGDDSNYQAIFPDNYSVSVDTNDVSVFSDSLSFAKGGRYTVAVYDTLMKIFDDD